MASDTALVVSPLDNSEDTPPLKEGSQTCELRSIQEPHSRVEELNPDTLSGLPFAAVIFIMCLGLFLATIETSITATALVSIGHHFNDSVTATWVVLSYLLSYMGFSVIIARVSDGLGRKAAIIICWALFCGFSLGSGLAQSLNQLIVFRALQGIGGSGLFSLAFIVLPQLSPVRLWGLISGFMGLALSCSYILGPVLGGIIVQRASWRWIYLFNAPAAVLGIGLLLIVWPAESRKRKSQPRLYFFSQMDVPGALFLLVASVLLVFAIQEAGALRYKWNSAAVIASLVFSGIFWCAFFAWTFWLEFAERNVYIKPILPLKAALTRPTGPAILMSFFTGFPFFVVIINLPLRFQIVNGDSPIMAGVHLLPMLGTSAVGSTIAGLVASKKNLTSHLLIVAACLLLLGSGLLSTVSHSRKISRSQYGYQVLFGLGTGISFSASALAITISNTYDKVASLQGALGQARVLGGSIGLAVATIIFNHNISVKLPASLTPSQLSDLQQSITTIFDLNPELRAQVARVFAESFNQQMRICTYLSAAALVVAACTWQKQPASIVDTPGHTNREEVSA